jgi:hypothetical protein
VIKWSAALVVALLLAAQFIPVERSNPPVESDLQAPVAVKEILKNACYDCHSNETVWPWYSRVAPMSWFLARHVAEGRKDLNFSAWPSYDFAAQELIFRELDKEISEGKMPLRSYTLGHPEARLSDSDREVLLEWIRLGF